MSLPTRAGLRPYQLTAPPAIADATGFARVIFTRPANAGTRWDLRRLSIFVDAVSNTETDVLVVPFVSVSAERDPHPVDAVDVATEIPTAFTYGRGTIVIPEDYYAGCWVFGLAAGQTVYASAQIEALWEEW